MNIVAFEFSKHASHRAKNRAISPEAVEEVISMGREYDAGSGCRGYFLGDSVASDIERDCSLKLTKSRRLAVILADAKVITVERCHRPPRWWRPTQQA